MLKMKLDGSKGWIGRTAPHGGMFGLFRSGFHVWALQCVCGVGHLRLLVLPGWAQCLVGGCPGGGDWLGSFPTIYPPPLSRQSSTTSAVPSTRDSSTTARRNGVGNLRLFFSIAVCLLVFSFKRRMRLVAAMGLFHSFSSYVLRWGMS